nr:MAG TPA: hypothetical protein [Caudoviricetes sp.]
MKPTALAPCRGGFVLGGLGSLKTAHGQRPPAEWICIEALPARRRRWRR